MTQPRWVETDMDTVSNHRFPISRVTRSREEDRASCKSISRWHDLLEGGWETVASLSRAGRVNWLVRLYEWGHRHFPAVLDCRPIFVQRALQQAGFLITTADQMSLWGLPAEVVLAG
jgi:hypothetical protein